MPSVGCRRRCFDLARSPVAEHRLMSPFLIASGELQSILDLSVSRVMNRQVASTSGLTTVRSRPPVGDSPSGNPRAGPADGSA